MDGSVTPRRRFKRTIEHLAGVLAGPSESGVVHESVFLVTATTLGGCDPAIRGRLADNALGCGRALAVDADSWSDVSQEPPKAAARVCCAMSLACWRGTCLLWTRV